MLQPLNACQANRTRCSEAEAWLLPSRTCFVQHRSTFHAKEWWQNQENWVNFWCGISLEAIAREILAKEQARLGHVKFLAVDSGDWLCLNPHTFSGHNFDTTRTTSAECSPYVDHFHLYLFAICHQRSVWQARSQNSSSENCVDYVTLLPLSQRIVLDSVKVDPKVCRLSKLAAGKCNVPPMSTKCL